MVTKDICKADLYLKGLLNYLQVNTPIKKTNTVNTLLEVVLKKNRVQLEERGIQLSRKLEKNLPEIIVPDEQLKFILNFILQYGILSIPPHGNLEFLTRSSIFQRDAGGGQTLFEKYGGYIEISVIFGSVREAMGHSMATTGGIPPRQKDTASGIMLRLVEQIVLKNRGSMEYRADEKSANTMISLKFPLERREVFLYDFTGVRPPPGLKS